MRKEGLKTIRYHYGYRAAFIAMEAAPDGTVPEKTLEPEEPLEAYSEKLGWNDAVRRAPHMERQRPPNFMASRKGFLSAFKAMETAGKEAGVAGVTLVSEKSYSHDDEEEIYSEKLGWNDCISWAKKQTELVGKLPPD